MCVYVHVSVHTHGGQKKALACRDGIRVSCEHCMCWERTQLKSFTRAARTLNCWAISQDQVLVLFPASSVSTFAIEL